MDQRPLFVRGKPLAGGHLPAVCAPLVARTLAELVAETRAVAAKKPDLLEWRVDFFDDIADTPQVLAAAAAVRNAAGGVPILFTRRAQREGGQPIPLDEDQVVTMYAAVIASGAVDLVDYEMDNDALSLARVRDLAHAAGLPLVLSFHDFQRTPSTEQLAARFAQAHSQRADVAKVAVMPQSMEDVLRLLGATLQASETLPIPVISMAMGGLGAVSRVSGGLFGSALTFAVGAAASAPGQMPIEDVRAAVAVLRRATSG
ncbi:type I 3-dehydroquinate dehydratase [Ramlibacter sp. PS3R-8]|uniref:type I 3-dehydroquinate dehydratase n=1 Tax=Ramlibacter sp. PS3R-8 TaxID=3133437 RepID=UPI0030A6348E